MGPRASISEPHGPHARRREGPNARASRRRDAPYNSPGGRGGGGGQGDAAEADEFALGESASSWLGTPQFLLALLIRTNTNAGKR